MKLLMFSSMWLSTMFMFTSHPISKMLVIIMQTFILCLNMWMYMSIGWFSYIMFLIYLGGLMVLFIYISSLAYNEKFKLINKEMISQAFLLLVISTPIFMFFEMKNLKQIKTETNELIFKIYSYSSTIITTMTIIYLIITLVVVVKMTSQFNGPLRAKN